MIFFQPIQKDLKSILSPGEHAVNWAFMQANGAPERFVSWEFPRAARGLSQWHRGSFSPFLANLITTSPMCLSKNSYIASNPFSWNVFQLCGDEPTQQPDSIVLNHLEQKTRHGGFYGAGLSQDERKDQALVWSTWRVAPQSGRLSGRKKGRGAKVFFSGDRSSYHCCNSDRLLQQLAPSTIQMAAGQTQSLFTPVVQWIPRSSLHIHNSSLWYYRGYGFYKGQIIHFHSFQWPQSWLCKDNIYSE